MTFSLRGYDFVAILSGTLLLALLSGCAPGKRPFLTARMCLTRPGEVHQLLQLLRRTADEEGLTYFDRTEETRKEAKALRNPITRPDGFILNVGALASDGMGFTASELGGNHYQIGLGFSESRRPGQAQELAVKVIGDLRKHWRVDVFPDGRPLHPAENCT